MQHSPSRKQGRTVCMTYASERNDDKSLAAACGAPTLPLSFSHDTEPPLQNRIIDDDQSSRHLALNCFRPVVGSVLKRVFFNKKPAFLSASLNVLHTNRKKDVRNAIVKCNIKSGFVSGQMKQHMEGSAWWGREARRGEGGQ